MEQQQTFESKSLTIPVNDLDIAEMKSLLHTLDPQHEAFIYDERMKEMCQHAKWCSGKSSEVMTKHRLLSLTLSGEVNVPRTTLAPRNGPKRRITPILVTFS